MQMKYEIKYASDWEEAEWLSSKGWELVSVCWSGWLYGFGQTYYYFKRPATPKESLT